MPEDSEFLYGPVTHNEAVDFIKSKPVVSRQVFDGLLPELKGRAFTIAGLEGQANVMETVRDRIAELPAGADWNKTKRAIADDISPFLVDPDAVGDELKAQEAAALRKAELLLRTHGFQAYQAAQYQVMDQNRDVMPYWQYQTMEDAYVRDTHAALDQIVLPADSPFWNNHFPPWDYGCRCQAIPISMFAHADLVKADKDRAADDKLVMEGPLLKRLEEGSITRNGKTFDVRSPVEKEGGSGFSWDPSSLRIPIEQLEQRYADQPQVFAEFVAFAKRTPLGPGQPTVWQWLGGSGGGRPVGPKPPASKKKEIIPPPPKHTPPPLPKPTLDDFIAQHTALPGKMTPNEAVKVVDALKQSHGITVADKVTKISVARALPAQWKTYVPKVVQEFIDFIPKNILDALPAFSIAVQTKLKKNVIGQYDPVKHVLSLSDYHLAGEDQKSRETIFHELAHWLHLEGAKTQSAELVAYAAAIKSHFNARTAGEPSAQLPNYGAGTIGRKDKFWDTYMGRVYAGIIDGSEIPTKTFELLCNPLYLSKLWNEPLHRETIKVALAILFS